MVVPKILDIGEGAFQNRPELKRHLAWESFIALAKKPGRVLIVDRTLQRRAMKSGFLLAISWGLSRRLKSWTSKERVGILFPPSLGGYVANLAVVFAGKVPVNVNFTLGRSGVEACLRQADVDCLLTTERVRAKLPDFPWPESGVVDLVEELKTLSKSKTVALLAALYVLPSNLLAKLLRVPSRGDRAEAGLLFTSGSSGEPKGVVLTHRNILGNCAQIDASGLLPSGEKIIANLPIFHSFGFTVTLWYPLLRGCAVVTVPSPLDIKKVAEAIEAESATILIGTPTFFRSYITRINPEKLKSLKYVVAGAEKTPAGFADLWESTFSSVYLEGYGLTETSPVVSINLPHAPHDGEYPGDASLGNRRGSVGRLMPGHAARILHPETMQELGISEVGVLGLKGPNVFDGYLNDPARTAEVKDGDWFITGDLARFDEDGFLYIEGRLSRFSKIAGEMVPHGTVEEALILAYDLLNADAPMLAIAGRPDEAKGEVLVLLAVLDFELGDVREKLSAAGFSNLWMPKEIKRVEFIPILASGKLDLRGIKALAQE
jgi:acyl-[acyl-carrier-protein]-phospholipid O-acyltransferase/long-chain-fatty-acid--[acyl-carrier-protein] ligase